MTDAILTSEKPISAMALAARRLILLERAKDQLGGAAKLGAIIGVSRRTAHLKLANDVRTTDFELRLVADAVDQRAAELATLATEIRAMLVPR